MSMNDGQQRKPGIVGLESGYPKTCHMHTPFFGTELLPTALSTIFTSYRYQDRTRPSFALQCWTGIKPLKLILCKYSDWNLYVWMYMYNIVFTYIHIIIWTHTHTCTNAQIRISILYCAHNLCEGGKAGSFGGGVRHSSGSVERLVQGACGLSKLYTSNGLFEALDFIFISFFVSFWPYLTYFLLATNARIICSFCGLITGFAPARLRSEAQSWVFSTACPTNSVFV